MRENIGDQLRLELPELCLSRHRVLVRGSRGIHDEDAAVGRFLLVEVHGRFTAIAIRDAQPEIRNIETLVPVDKDLLVRPSVADLVGRLLTPHARDEKRTFEPRRTDEAAAIVEYR